MQKESWYRPIYVIAAIWKESGWGTVVYLATISGLDPSIYEAAAIDGASRFGKIRYITFPLLIPTIVTVLKYDKIDYSWNYHNIIRPKFPNVMPNSLLSVRFYLIGFMFHAITSLAFF